MRSLLLFRHAKSSWDQPGLDDIDRPLAPRGEQAALLMGRYLRRRSITPGLVLCSPAVRTQETWRLTRAELDAEPPLEIRKSLYLATPSRLLTTVHRLPDSCRSIMLIGHNPGLATFAAHLCGAGPKKALARLRQKFPTAALAEIGFACERWSEVSEGQGRLVAFTRPKDLD